MIFRYQVENLSRQSLDSRLRTNATALEYLTHPYRFDQWVDLLHARCNELSWAIRSKYALIDFIDKATIEYARKQLDKAELKYDGGQSV